MRKVHSYEFNNVKAVVYRDAEWEEFRVRLYEDGKLNEAADYFTDDKEDARDTAFAMVNAARTQINVN